MQILIGEYASGLTTQAYIIFITQGYTQPQYFATH